MPISDKFIDQLLKGCDSPEDIFGEAGLLKQLTKKVAERALNAEMEQHLRYAKHAPEGRNSGNSRIGKSSKKGLQFTAKSILISLVTAAVALNPSSSKKAKSSSTALMTGLSRCMREA